MPTTFARAPGVLERWLGPTVRLLRAGTGAVIVLEGAGAMVWAALTRSGAVDDIVDAMTAVAPPDVAPDQARAIVDDALTAMVSAGLVTETLVP